ncbi:MAG: hypothetical protein MI923_16100 [Phycisphaerales bacterium]|nr:hypothetical protein [Phycisphaerales bacterium]
MTKPAIVHIPTDGGFVCGTRCITAEWCPHRVCQRCTNRLAKPDAAVIKALVRKIYKQSVAKGEALMSQLEEIAGEYK